jgi:hypothetical protein
MYLFKEKVMKELLIFMIGYIVGLGMQNAQAQTYVIQNPAGYSQGTVQVRGNQAQVVNNAGYVTQSVTVYPAQVTNQFGAAIGASSYTVPPSPPSPPSPRVLQ